VPNGQAQKAVLRAALKDSRLKPADVSYIEAHGTGTPLGDPIEIHALIDVFTKERSDSDPLTVGSVKTNIGHLEAAAGIAGVIKVVLAMQNERIPRHLHLHRLNPHISINGAAVRFPKTAIEWPAAGRKRIAGVSSFGISGTNSHVVIEEAPRVDTASEEGSTPPRKQHLLLFSARSQKGLSDMAGRLHDRLAADSSLNLERVCHTLATARARFPVRAAVKAEQMAQMLERLTPLVREETAPGVLRSDEAVTGKPCVAFLFSGQGAQYSGMGRTLYSQEPIFRAALDRADGALKPHLGGSIIEVIHSDAKDARLHQTGFTQPALFALEYALAMLWRGWGVEPELVMGHSVGEYTAACVAGVLTLDETAELIATRGRLMQVLPEGGGMAAIFAPLEVVEERIKAQAGRIGIAAANTPRNTVVSGDQAALDALLERFETEGIRSTPLNVSHAFHSHLMEPMLDDLRKVAAKMVHRQPTMHYVSNLTGTVVDRGTLGPDYWAKHARHTVQFEKNMRTAVEVGCTLFLEIGPHATLIAMAQQIITDPGVRWLTSLRRGANDWDVLSDALAELHVQGANIDWGRVFVPVRGAPLILPTYPFERERFWVERRQVMPGDTPHEVPAIAGQGKMLHPLLGQRVPSAGKEILFQATLSVDVQTWLADHKVDGEPIFPATGYWEIALAAAGSAAPGRPAVLEEVAFEAPLPLKAGATTMVQTVLRRENGGMVFEVHSHPAGGGGWRRHALGRIAFKRPQNTVAVDLEALSARCGETQDVQENYARMRSHGMEYGPAFQGICELRGGRGESLGRIARPAMLSVDTQHLHPALSDACLQTLGTTFPMEDGDTLYLPVALERLDVLTDALPESFSCHAVLRERGSDTLTSDLELLSDQGMLLARVTGMRLRRTSLAKVKRALGGVQRSLYQAPVWVEAPLDGAEATPEGAALLISDERGIAPRLGEGLRLGGVAVQQVFLPHTASAEAIAALVTTPVEEKRVTRVVALTGCNLMPERKTDRETIGAGADLTQGQMLNLVKGLAALGDEAPALILVTCGAQAVAAGPSLTAPEASLLWGFGRATQTELPLLHSVLCDLDPADIPGSVQRLAQQLLHPDGENQIAWRHDMRFTARLATLPEPAVQERQRLQLQIPQRGELGGLALVPMASEAPGPGQVKIAVQATGLNFRDVLNALDMYPGDPGPLGSECAGTIVALGAGVSGLKIGDKVTGIVPGSFRTEVLADARQVAVIPEEMDFAGAATLPVAFLTAHYALNRLGGMKRGDRVLIHAAAGGVGQAAVQLAKQAGAEIFATAGNPEKRTLLKRQGVAHVMDSRSVAFADEVMAITRGEGVDLALNSLVGEALQKSLDLVRKGGRFVEIGKMELLDEAALEAWPDIEYHTIALDSLSASDPALVEGMLSELMVEFSAGRLQPLSWHGFTLERAVDAFRFMHQAKHIGKIVLTQPQAAQQTMPVVEDGTYLITGGLGGLGLYVAEHLAARGAGAVALLGRRPPSDSVRQRLKTIEDQGCKVVYLQADVTYREELERALAKLEGSDTPPLRGLIHAAGVLDDGSITRQTAARFDKVMAPKVRGGWNLHELTLGKPIDLFVMFSSASAVMGAAGQSNYAAANGFLDALAHYRQARGLVATSINWGPWSGLGMAAELDDVGVWEARGMEPIRPECGMEMLDRILDAAPAQIMALPIDWPQFLSQLPPGTRIPLLDDLDVQQRADSDAEKQTDNGGMLRAELERVPQSMRRDRLQEVVVECLLKVLGMRAGSRIDPRQPLNDLGVDSLMAVELRNALVRIVGLPLPATLLFDYPNVTALTGYLADEVLGLTPSAEDLATPAAQTQAEAAAIAELSEHELEASLEDELQRVGF